MPLLVKEGKILLNKYEFYVDVNNTNIPFIISDQPALFVFIKCNEICIPLSTKTVIIMRAKGDDIQCIADIIPSGYEINLTKKM